MKILYTTVNSVKVRLQGKVQFESSTGLLDGELSDEFLIQLISDAEMEIEQELRGRYAIPFRSKAKGTFDALPDHTKRAIRVVVDYKAVMKILEADFGRGAHVNGDSYYTNIKDSYDKDIIRLMGRDVMASNTHIDRYKVSPPLEDLLLAVSNQYADDGYRGMIINTDASQNDPVSYAAKEINDPSKSYIRTRGFGGL